MFTTVTEEHPLIFSLVCIGAAFNLVHQSIFNFFDRHFSYWISNMSVWEQKHRKIDSTCYCILLVFSVFWVKYRRSLFQVNPIKADAGPYSWFLVCTCPEKIDYCPLVSDIKYIHSYPVFWFFHVFLSFLLGAVLWKSHLASKHCV